MHRKHLSALLVLFILLRLPFLSTYPHFYDSPEYLKLSNISSFAQAIEASHVSVHPLYIFITQLAQQIPFLGSVQSLSLVSFIFGLISFIGFYFLVKTLFNKRLALLSLLPLIFFPHTFLTQTQVLHESVSHSLFVLGLLFGLRFLIKRTFSNRYLSVLFFGLSIFNYVGMIIWLPLFPLLATWFSMRSKRKISLLYSLVISFLSILLSLLLLFLVFRFSGINPVSRLFLLFLGEGGALLNVLSPLGALRSLRNALMVTFFGYSPMVIPLILGFIFFLLRNRRPKDLLALLGILTLFTLNVSFWHGGLFGRLGGLVAFPFALLVALIPSRKLYILTLLSIVLLWSNTAFSYLQTPVPSLQKGIIDTLNMREGSILVLSEYQRPQLEGFYTNDVYIGSNTIITTILEIELAIKQGRDIYISQQALTFPYWQYDGQQIHIISRGDSKKAHLYEYLKDKALTKVSEDDSLPLLAIYKIENSTIAGEN